jgi:hypothetical protein
MTPDTLVGLKDTAIGEAFLYRQTVHAGLSGVRENSLWDLLMSRISNVGDEITESSVGKNKSFFLPYFMREQEDHINAHAFAIHDGDANPLAGSTVGGVYHRTDTWRLTVKVPDYTGISQFALTSPLTNIERYFLPGEYLITLGLNGANGTTTYMRIVDVQSAGNNMAYVIVEPNHREAPAQTVFQPTAGLVQLGVNRVSDYKPWAYNQPSDLSRRLLAYWPQYSRFTRCWDDLYTEYLDALFDGKVNPYWERFKELPMAEQNRQQYAIYQRKLLNSFFYGQAIDEFQTPETYRQLPEVRDPRGNNGFIEYEANALGLRTQLQACNRVIDRGGAPLDLNELEEYVYALKRYREVDGGTVDSIDVMTDKNTASRILTLMASYYKSRLGISWERNFGRTEKIAFGTQTMWKYNTYELIDAQVELNVIVEPFFADFKIQASAAGVPNRGNHLMFIDWPSVQFGVAKVNSRTSKTPDIDTDPDFRFVIDAVTSTCEMESVQWTPVVNHHNKSLIWENFSDECPTYTYEDCAATS